MRKLKKVNYKHQLIEQYALGGWLKDNAGLVGSIAGAGIGSLIAPGIGTSMGASLGGQLVGKMQQDNQEQNMQQQPNLEQQRFALNRPVQQTYTPTFKGGGFSKQDGIPYYEQYQYPEGGETKPEVKGYDSDTIMTQRRMDVFKHGIDSPEVYDDIEQNPEKVGSYFTALKDGDTPTPYTQRFLINYNNRFAKEPGTAYDVNKASLRMNPSSNWNKVNPDAISDTTKAFNPYIPQLPKRGYDYSGLATGTGQYARGGYVFENGSMTPKRDRNTTETKGVNKLKSNNQKYHVDNQMQGNAELEDGEVFRTPDGNMQKVNGNTHAEGGEQYNLPNPTAILGKNESKSGKQYKEEGDKLMRDYTKYKKVLASSPTSIAKRSAQLMLDKVQNKFNMLMSQQEAEKGHLGEQGSTISMPQAQFSKSDKVSHTDSVSGNPGFIDNPRDVQEWAKGGMYRNKLYPVGGYNFEGDNIPIPDEGSVSQAEDSGMFQPDVVNMANTGKLASSQQSYTPNNQMLSGSTGSNALTTLGTYAPIAYNLAQGIFGKAKQIDPQGYQDPYETQVRDIMAKRHYDPSAELEANKVGTAEYYRNLRQAAPSQGQYMAGLQSGQIAKQRGDADVYSRVNNAENQYRGEEAQMLDKLGERRAQTELGIEDINERARSAQQRFLPTALSQLQQASQVAQQMKGQKGLDEQRIKILQGMFKNYGYDWSKLLNPSQYGS
jgi:hypothetical protein